MPLWWKFILGGSMTTPQDPAKKKALEHVFAHLEKQFGEGTIMTLGKHSKRRKVSMIPTGTIALDIATGIGGVPRGRITEIYGPEASGKTTLANHITANCQKQNGTVAYIDAEHALDPAYTARIGVNLEELMISQPDCGEDALNIAEMLARSNAVDLIVVDSVAALVPRTELEGEIGDPQVGLQARMMSQALRKLNATISKSNTALVFINQVREKIGISYGNPETTTGGRALKFYASLRLEIRRIASIKSSEDDIGNRVRVKVVKNKLAPPFRTAEFDIMFNEGISKLGSIIDIGVTLGVIEKKGTWFSYKEHKFGQGKETCKEEMKKNPVLIKEIEDRIFELSFEKNPLLLEVGGESKPIATSVAE